MPKSESQTYMKLKSSYELISNDDQLHVEERQIPGRRFYSEEAYGDFLSYKLNNSKNIRTTLYDGSSNSWYETIFGCETETGYPSNVQKVCDFVNGVNFMVKEWFPFVGKFKGGC